MSVSFQAGVDETKGFPRPLVFWSIGFLYASFLAVMLQKLVLPLMPEMHAGNGLLHNDALAFHNLAVEAAERILSSGWSEWRLFPGAAGNVGVLSALYALFGPDPAWFIPINAAAHATGALFIYRMGPLLWPGRVGLLGGVMGGVVFLAFPSALQWYGQNHKDAFAIAGVLMMLYAWLRVQSTIELPKSAMVSVAFTALGGALLLGAVRPYFPLVVVVAFVASWGVLFVWTLLGRRFSSDWKGSAYSLVLIGVISVVAAVTTTQSDSSVSVYGEQGQPVYGEQGQPIVALGTHGSSWQWRSSEVLPATMDKMLKRASQLRIHFIEFGRSVGAGSGIDEDRAPNDATSALAYLPRALAVGLFTPFPESWTERVSAPRLIGAFETAVWYLFAIGIVFFGYRLRSRAFIAGLVFCVVILVVLSYVHPNVGTLYRQRYGVWMFLLLCGAVGWASVVLQVLSKVSGQAPNRMSRDVQEGVIQIPGQNNARVHSVERLAASGMVVVMITLACYLGFLARDLLLFNHLGMNEHLDVFFAAAMIPMFFVTFLAMPFADALMLPFLDAAGAGGKQRSVLLVRSVLTFAAIVLGTATLLVVLLAPHGVSLVLHDAGPSQIEEATRLLRWFAPILFLSAWTVIGNAVLNGLHRSREAALAQLVVPVVTVVALMVFPAENGPYVAIGGMLAGTLCNLFIVAYYARSLGFDLLPARIPSLSILRPILIPYRQLVLASLFTAALVPVNFMFAGTLVAGAVSAWALSSKIVILFSGLASVGVSAVVLPHLASLVSQGTRFQLRSDAYFLMLAGSWIGGGLSFCVLVFAEPLVAILFSGDGTLPEQIADLASLVKIGALQLPIVIAGAVVSKMAVVAGASSRVVFAAAAGLAGNVLINAILVPRLGILGIGIGSLMATVLSTIYLAIATRRQCGFRVREILLIAAGWFAWGCAGVAVYSQSVAAGVSVVLGLFGLGVVQWRAWRDAHSADASGPVRNVANIPF